MSGLTESIRLFFKRLMVLQYGQDGKVAGLLRLPLLVADCGKGKYNPLYLRFPIRFPATWLYRLFYASQPIVPNKIVFDNYMGKGYGCNPKYVAEKLLEKYPGQFDIVWVLSKSDAKTAVFPEGIRTVLYNTPESRREYATAKVWVSNYHKISYVRKGMYKKPGQYFIQLWHGSLGIKKIENDASVLTQDPHWLRLAQKSSDMVDYWISNSKFESEVYRSAFWNVRTILEYGHPRDDCLVLPTGTSRCLVGEYFELDPGQKICFYAPTFREDYRLDCYQIDFEALKLSLEKRFGGDWVILVRLHPRVRKYSSKIIPDVPYVLDATYYTDIQELVASADCMITDYSSCLFDFVLTHRPGFIFATDIQEYNQERGFYYPLESAPFPIATNNKELLEKLEHFDAAKYQADVQQFLQDRGCIEDGHASERVADLIVKLTNVQGVGQNDNAASKSND